MTNDPRENQTAYGETDYTRLAKALIKATGLHGRPNSFACGELWREYSGPIVMRAGLIGSDTYRLSVLRDVLGRLAGTPWGSLSYAGGRFYV